MSKNNLYENYHKNIRLQKRVITDNDFTYRNTLSYIKKYIPKLGNVLDIGSATGTISLYFASKGLMVDGIELSRNAVKFANLNKDKFGFNNVRFYNTSIEKFGLFRKYNLITCFEVLEHTKDDLKTLKLIRRRMNKDTFLIITVPSITAPLYQLGLLDNFDKEVGHLRRYSLNDIKLLFQKTKIKIVKIHKTEGVLRSALFTNNILNKFVKFTKINFVNNLIIYLDNFLLDYLPESQYILICKII